MLPLIFGAQKGVLLGISGGRYTGTYLTHAIELVRNHWDKTLRLRIDGRAGPPFGPVARPRGFRYSISRMLTPRYANPSAHRSEHEN